MIPAAVALLGLTAASCGSAALSGMDAAAEDASSVALVRDGDTDLISAGSPGPLVHGQPILPRQASDWWELFDIDVVPEFEIDWEALFDAMHATVAHGDNMVEGDAYLAKAASVEDADMVVGSHVEEIFPGVEVPVLDFAPRPQLNSAPGELSYVTYGLKGIPFGDDVVEVKVNGTAELGEQDGAGLYIGIGDYDNGYYRWFGPYSEDSATWKLKLFALDAVSDMQRAYITLATYNGDSAHIRSLEVKIGAQVFIPGFNWGEIEILGEDGFVNPDLFELAIPEPPIPIPDPGPGI